MTVKLESSGMQWIEGSICQPKETGGIIGDTYLPRQQQLQAKLSVLSWHLRVSATVLPKLKLLERKYIFPTKRLERILFIEECLNVRKSVSERLLQRKHTCASHYRRPRF